MLDNLALRAEILRLIRHFFHQRSVLEVETPLLGRSASLDPHLQALTCSHPLDPEGPSLYLQTSPELAMKRLLAAGSGSIYQMGPAFRGGEQGALHNPEFTMLEWYRVGWDHHRLLDEVDELMAEVLDTDPSDRATYAQAFQERLGMNPHTATVGDLQETARSEGLDHVQDLDRDGWLQLLMSHLVEPKLGHKRPVFLLDYPASQAALARIREDKPPVAERFELFIQGMELANGYHELTDPDEHRRRFQADLAKRTDMGLPSIPIDENFLAALEEGLPPCAGVALGVDRLVLLAAGGKRLNEVLAFPFDTL